MNAAPLAVVLAWLLFAGSHLLFGLPPLRTWLARRLGEARFVAAFSALAAFGLAVLAICVAGFGGRGPAALAAAVDPIARGLAAGVSAAGLLLAFGALAGYPRSPMALFRHRFAPPSGFAKITRHGFFVGLLAFALAHAALSRTLAQQVFFVGFAVLAGVGVVAQDRKLTGRHGEAWSAYRSATSVVPFAALLDGRQRFDAGDRMGFQVLRAAAVVAGVLVLHPLWQLGHGAPLAALMALGGAWVSWRRWRAAGTPAN